MRADDWLTPDEVAPLEEARISVAVAEVAREAIEVAGGTVCWGGAGSWMNEGRGIGLGGPVSRADVDRAVAFLRDRGAKARFDDCPYAHPTFLARLGDHGLRALGFETVLYRALGEVEAPPTALELVPVDADLVDTFATHVGRWFSEDGVAPSEVDVWSMRRVLEHRFVEGYLVRAEGRWVGGGGLELGPETGRHRIAALIMTSVAPAFRRRGVQRPGCAEGRMCAARRDARGTAHGAHGRRPDPGASRPARHLHSRCSHKGTQEEGCSFRFLRWSRSPRRPA